MFTWQQPAGWSLRKDRGSVLVSTNTSCRGTDAQTQLCPALESLEKQYPGEGLTEVIIALRLHGTEVAQNWALLFCGQAWHYYRYVNSFGGSVSLSVGVMGKQEENLPFCTAFSHPGRESASSKENCLRLSCYGTDLLAPNCNKMCFHGCLSCWFIF